MEIPLKIIVAVTGASGSIYARLLCQHLSQCEQVGEIALLVTENGRRVAAYEDQTEWMEQPRWTRYDNSDFFCGPASGSACYDAMVIVPCSMGMVGRIASGVSDDLIARAADVMLKERRRLIVVPRETPFNTLHLRNLTTLSECGAVILPAAPSFYSGADSVQALCETVVERIVALLGIRMPHYEWGASVRSSEK